MTAPGIRRRGSTTEQARITRSRTRWPVPAADPGANRMDWHQDVRPRAAVDVPPGYLAVKLANATPSSAGTHLPGDVAVLPHDEAAALLRAGYARPVLPS
jgi:hypothetical protein